MWPIIYILYCEDFTVLVSELNPPCTQASLTLIQYIKQQEVLTIISLFPHQVNTPTPFNSLTSLYMSHTKLSGSFLFVKIKKIKNKKNIYITIWKITTTDAHFDSIPPH